MPMQKLQEYKTHFYPKQIMNNTNQGGFIILNADDNFYKLHKKIADKKKLNIISFGIKNKKSDIKLLNIKRKKTYFKITIKSKNFKKSF